MNSAFNDDDDDDDDGDDDDLFVCVYVMATRHDGNREVTILLPVSILRGSIAQQASRILLPKLAS